VLVQVLKRFSRIRRHPNPTALLLRMCINQALDHLRRCRSRRAALARLPVDSAPAPASPAGQLAQAEDRERLLAFVGSLPAREAEAVTLHILEELDYAAVAEAMGCSQSTVRVHVGRARERFRSAFGAGRGRESTDSRLPKPEPQPD
jgi:RNA polymerase sigma factor (sigma-70 family)